MGIKGTELRAPAILAFAWCVYIFFLFTLYSQSYQTVLRTIPYEYLDTYSIGEFNPSWSNPMAQAARFKNQRAAGKLLLSYAIGLHIPFWFACYFLL